MKNKLTPKQERFIQNIVSGMSQRQAYKDAYNAENMKDETIDTEASILFNDQKVSKRYQELIEELQDKAIMTAKERMQWLTDVINGEILEDIPLMTDIKEDKVNTIKCPTKIDTKMKAMDILNKMSGEYTTKIEGDIGIKKLEDVL